jgi:hypothetical protein
VTPILAAAETAVAYSATRRVCEGATHAVAEARTETHHVVGLALEMGRHPSGNRQLAPPVVVAFDRRQWLRVAVLTAALARRGDA